MLWELARSLQPFWHPRRNGPTGMKEGNTNMALRFETFARSAVAFVGAAAFTLMMVANTVSLGPVA